MEKQHPLSLLCTDNNLVRSSLYSDTYQKVCSINKVQKLWQVVHVQIPCSPEKEQALKETLHLQQEDLPAFYSAFSEHLKQEISTYTALIRLKDPDLSNNLIIYSFATEVTRTDGTKDYYFLSDPTDPAIGSKLIQETSVSYLTLLAIGVRLCMCAKTLHKYGYCLEQVDMNSLVMSREEKPLMKLSSLLYASKNGEIQSELALRNPCLIDPEAATAETQDTFMIATLLWSLAHQYRYGNILSYSEEFERNPQIPNEFYEFFAEVFHSGQDKTIKQLLDGLHSLRKSYIKVNKLDFMIELTKEIKPEIEETPEEPEIEIPMEVETPPQIEATPEPIEELSEIPEVPADIPSEDITKLKEETSEEKELPKAMTVTITDPLSKESFQGYGDKITIGCGSASDIQLKNPTEVRAISRSHAEVILDHGKVYLKDISTNGTYLHMEDGEEAYTRLKKGVPTEIKHGSLVKFASRVMLIYFELIY